MYQNAGEKGLEHLDPEDPPRRRGNKRPGHGNFENDRPPIVGTVGRESGEVQLRAVERADKATLQAHVEATTRPGSTLHTDEWGGYNDVQGSGREHRTVRHNPVDPEWARDEDGDGKCEVHCNTSEGIWVGVRNFLRMFRGVSKWFLWGYVATFAAVHNAVWINPDWFSFVFRCSSSNTT